METIIGRGKLYDASEKQIMASIEYEIYHTTPTKHHFGEWNGNFVLEVDNVVSLGEYILVLQDKRKGKVIIKLQKMRPNATIYYEFQGSGPLK